MAKRIASYCRVSTDKDDQLNSLENQRSYFAREIEKQGHILHHIYADEGLSGTKLANRDGFLQMLHDAGIDVHGITTTVNGRRKTHTVFDVSEREPLFDEIWIKNTSRFARNTLSYEIISLLRAKKVNVHFMSEGIDTMDMSQDLLLKLMQVFDENESKDKSAKTRWGNEESARRGRIRTSKKLYGYNYDRANNTLTIIPEEAEVIRSIFEMYASGMGIRVIISKLTAQGIRTRNGKVFGKTCIRNILCNEKYAGLNNALKYDTGVVFIDKHYPKPKDSYIIEPSDRIEPIVSVELFERCKATRSSKVNYQKAVGRYNGLGPYASLLYCASCGARFHRNIDKGRRFYNCGGKKLHGTQYCNSANVSEAQVDALIQELCDGLYDYLFILQALTAIGWLADEILRLCDMLDSDVDAITQHIDTEIEKQVRIRDRYYDIYALNDNPDPSVLERIKAINTTIKQLNDERAEATRGNDSIIRDVICYHGVIKQITDVFDVSSFNEYKEPRQVDRQTVMSNLTAIRVETDEHGKPALQPELRFAKQISDIIGNDDWTKKWRDIPVETVDRQIAVTMQRIKDTEPWRTKLGIVS